MTTEGIAFVVIDGETQLTSNLLKNRHGIIGDSSVIQEVVDTATKVAATDTTVLITGESGTGKELIARLIYKVGARRRNKFKAVNCAAFTDTLLESELFGHEAGSFTGAISRKIGVLEFVNKGTLFLDEVAEMSPSLQAKILRAIQDGTFNRVGSNTELVVDVRVIAASNKNLLDEVHKGRFREDLYYRLNVVQISLPALRNRKSDIMLLAEHFLSKFKREQEYRFSDKTTEALIAYHWPGNVRELENAIERAVIMSGSEVISPRDLPSAVTGNAVGGFRHDIFGRVTIDSFLGLTLKESIIGFKREYLILSLVYNDWSVTKTAETLGIQRTYLSRLTSELGIVKGSTK
jgi:DNA-binding NtrC family response regulator